jgi:predicted HAD superfamily hydrolase
MDSFDFNNFRKKTLLLSRGLQSRPVGSSAIENIFRAQLAAATAISFDIFDTLTTRSVYHPHDVYKFLAAHPTFQALPLPAPDKVAAARLKAELKAYEQVLEKEGNPNANLREIYEIFCELLELDPAHVEPLALAEEEVEIQLALSNEEGAALFNDAVRTGKTLVIVSDTYHRPEFLLRLLAHCGYTVTPGQLYSSSDRRASKGEGKLFEIVLEDLKIPPGSLLHLGDNGFADHYIPGRMGIVTLWHPFRAHGDTLPDYHPEFEPLHSQIKSLTERARMPRRSPADFWRQLGYTVAGPLVTGFALWLRRHFEEDKVSRAYFLLRDGALIHRIYEIVAGESSPCPTQTLPSSRRSMVFPILDLNVDLVLPQLVFTVPGDVRPVGEFLRRLRIDPAQFEEEIAAAGLGHSGNIIDGYRETLKLIALFKRPRLTKTIIEQAQKERALLSDYLKQEGVAKPGHVALVDIGWAGSIQKAIHTLFQAQKLPIQVTGYYLGTTPRFTEALLPDLAGHGYLFNLGKPKSIERMLSRGCEVVENMCTSPEGSLVSFRREGKKIVPVFGEPEIDPAHARNIVSMHDGAAEFAHDFKSRLGKSGKAEIPAEIAVENLLRLLSRPTSEEALELGKIIHCENLGSTRGRPLAVFRSESSDPLELWEDYQKAYWKEGLLNQSSAQSAHLRTLLWLMEEFHPGFRETRA